MSATSIFGTNHTRISGLSSGSLIGSGLGFRIAHFTAGYNVTTSLSASFTVVERWLDRIGGVYELHREDGTHWSGVKYVPTGSTAWAGQHATPSPVLKISDATNVGTHANTRFDRLITSGTLATEILAGDFTIFFAASRSELSVIEQAAPIMEFYSTTSPAKFTIGQNDNNTQQMRLYIDTIDSLGFNTSTLGHAETQNFATIGGISRSGNRYTIWSYHTGNDGGVDLPGEPNTASPSPVDRKIVNTMTMSIGTTYDRFIVGSTSGSAGWGIHTHLKDIMFFTQSMGDQAWTAYKSYISASFGILPTADLTTR